MGRMKDLSMRGVDELFDSIVAGRSRVYPDAPGFKEQTTSRESAAKVAPDADNFRCLVLQAVRRQPSTTDEVAAALDLSVLTVRPRMSELRALGNVEPSGLRRKNESGHSAIVWRERVPS